MPVTEWKVYDDGQDVRRTYVPDSWHLENKVCSFVRSYSLTWHWSHAHVKKLKRQSELSLMLFYIVHITVVQCSTYTLHCIVHISLVSCSMYIQYITYVTRTYYHTSVGKFIICGVLVLVLWNSEAAVLCFRDDEDVETHKTWHRYWL